MKKNSGIWSEITQFFNLRKKNSSISSSSSNSMQLISLEYFENFLIFQNQIVYSTLYEVLKLPASSNFLTKTYLLINSNIMVGPT